MYTKYRVEQTYKNTVNPWAIYLYAPSCGFLPFIQNIFRPPIPENADILKLFVTDAPTEVLLPLSAL